VTNLYQKVFSDNLKVSSGQVILRALAIPFLIFYARVLTPFELSVFPIFTVLAAMSTVFFNFGLFPTIVREVPKLLNNNKEKAISLLQTGSLIVAIGVVIFTILTFILSAWIASVFFKGSEHANIIKLMSIGFFFFGLFTIIKYNFAATSEFGKLALTSVISGIMFKVFPIIFYLLWGVTGLIIGMDSALGVTVFISLFF
jgi:O-antigen/teichoic acid export membrane protein